MARIVRLATCQPPAPRAGIDGDAVVERALELLKEGGQQGADICCLPECLNVMGRQDADIPGAGRTAKDLEARVAAVGREFAMHVVLPLIEWRDAALHNTAVVLGRDGKALGRYDKTHLTQEERDRWGVVPGDTYPVFDLDFGRVGVMICYDGCFPEPARILALKGAEVLFFPSLQRGYTEDQLALQVRARAADNFAHVVRSSYGTERTDPWEPGVMVGKSCIVAADGTIAADLGKHVGVALTTVDLDAALLGRRSHAGELGVVRDMRFADRRPDTYGRLTETRG